MDSSDVSQQGQMPKDSNPSPPSETIEAVEVPRNPNALRRCFICLTDEEPSDPKDSWVDPCPCTLEAHQDCMLAWVTDCERSNRPLKCPVCKSDIKMEGAWDPLVSLNDEVGRRFTRASPFMLFTAVSMGIQFSLQMYGAMALWTFSGKDTFLRYALGPDLIIDGRRTGSLSFARERLSSALVLMNVAPALLLSQVFPGFSNKIFLPTASVYGAFHVMHDDHFFSWPPSPQLAIAVFPYIRSVYYNLWRELVLPYEIKLNRQLLGLPPHDTTGANATGQQNENHANQVRNREPGLLEMLQNLVEALAGDEDDGEQHAAGGNVGGEAGQGDQMVLELVIEEIDADGDENVPDLVDRLNEQPAANRALEGAQPEDADLQDQPNEAGVELNAPGEQAQNHEAPPAPPARRVGLGGLLSSISNSIISALILPGVSFAAGEVLRVLLPAKWTTAQLGNPWLRPGSNGRPGLLQQQWGRSLVGGCLYVVLRDMVRVYTKSRKVTALSNRRVKNVDRARRGKS